MGTLRAVKFFMKTDRDLRKLLLRGGRSEILIDLDGDKEADIAMYDVNHDGNIDTFAADLFNTGEFNLYLEDTNMSGIPDTIFLDEEGNGEFKRVAEGEGVENNILVAAQALYQLVQLENIVAEELDAQLRELDKAVKQARKELRKL